MGVITYLTGDATAPGGEGHKIIAHIVNSIGAWGAGFVVAVSRRWSEPELAYRRWYEDRLKNDFYLGAVQIVKVPTQRTSSFTFVANMVAQEGIRSHSKGPPIRYDALSECLYKLGEKADNLQASIHMPRIGCGLAGGKWNEVEPLVEDALGGHNVFVYDFKL